MTIEALKNAKLSRETAGYLGIVLKLWDLDLEATNIVEANYAGKTDEMTEDFQAALQKAQDAIMKLAVMSITENLCLQDPGEI